MFVTAKAMTERPSCQRDAEHVHKINSFVVCGHKAVALHLQNTCYIEIVLWFMSLRFLFTYPISLKHFFKDLAWIESRKCVCVSKTWYCTEICSFYSPFFILWFKTLLMFSAYKFGILDLPKENLIYKRNLSFYCRLCRK